MEGGRKDKMQRKSKEGRIGVKQKWIEGWNQGQKEAGKIEGMKEQEMNGVAFLALSFYDL